METVLTSRALATTGTASEGSDVIVLPMTPCTIDDHRDLLSSCCAACRALPHAGGRAAPARTQMHLRGRWCAR